MTTRTRTILITGAGSGLGSSLARRFAARGDFVVGVARTTSALQKVRRSIAESGGRCAVISCDVRNDRDVRKAVKFASEQAGPLSVLINNAGVTVFKNFAHTSVGELAEIIDTNLKGTMLMTKAVLPAMLKRKSGMIVNVISYAAKTTYRGSAAYSAAKAGVAAMMNVLREEIRGSGIRVVNVFPGAVATPMWPSGARKKYADVMTPPDDISHLVYDITMQPSSLTVEEIVIRPPIGDLRL